MRISRGEGEGGQWLVKISSGVSDRLLRPFRTIHLSQAKPLPVFVHVGESTKSPTFMIMSFRPFRTIHQIVLPHLHVFSSIDSPPNRPPSSPCLFVPSGQPTQSSSLISLSFRPFRTIHQIVLPHLHFSVFSSLQDNPPDRPLSSRTTHPIALPHLPVLSSLPHLAVFSAAHRTPLQPQPIF